LGQAGSKKGTPTASAETASANNAQVAAQTHEVTPGNTSDNSAEPAPEQSAKTEEPKPARKHSASAPPAEDTEAAGPSTTPVKPERTGEFVPQAGQTFLQVAAVGRDEAEGVADVLRKRGFHAHAVPKPGSPKIYRVIIGPLRDAADLSTTRDALRRTGFREVITQHY
jgi:cell division septation protein DedD